MFVLVISLVTQAKKGKELFRELFGDEPRDEPDAHLPSEPQRFDNGMDGLTGAADEGVLDEPRVQLGLGAIALLQDDIRLGESLLDVAARVDRASGEREVELTEAIVSVAPPSFETRTPCTPPARSRSAPAWR